MFVVIENKKSVFLTAFGFGYSVDTLLFSNVLATFECTVEKISIRNLLTVSTRCLFSEF